MRFTSIDMDASHTVELRRLRDDERRDELGREPELKSVPRRELQLPNELGCEGSVARLWPELIAIGIESVVPEELELERGSDGEITGIDRALP